jgi:hypothetical protein
MARYGLGDRADAWRADVARLGPVAAGQQWRPEMREAGLTRFIAMPGGSQHQRGTAVDFALNGALIRDADSPAAQFIRNNAAQYGLSVPMSWEPWQVEPVGSRDGSRPQAAMTTRNATALSPGNATALSPGAALNFRGAPQMAMQSTQPQGLLGQLGIQRQDPTAQGETALPFYRRNGFSNTMGNLAMAFNSLRQNPDENIPRIITGQRATREQDAANNRTIEWFLSQPDGARYAEMAEAMGTQVAFQAYQADAERARASAAAAAALARGEIREVDGRLVRVMADGTVQEIYGGAQSPGQLTGDQLTGLNSLRDDLRTELKTFEEVRSGYNNITTFYNNPSATSDYALAVAFAKILDPGSVAREGEVSAVQNAGARVPALGQALRNAVTGEGQLTPQVRQEIAELATKLYADRRAEAQTVIDGYGEVAVQAGLPAEFLYSGTLPEVQEVAPAATTSAPPLTQSAIDAGVTQRRWDNMTPEQRSAFP